MQTSTTNIGAYMWSVIVAEKLGIISHDEAVARLSRTIGTLEGMERHDPSGQFYNWYDARTGEKLTHWPPSDEPLTPILSSVDNGWLATGLQVVRNSVPDLRNGAERYTTAWISASTTGPRSTASCFTTPLTPARRLAATTPW